MVQGSGFRIQGLGFRVQGKGVWGQKKKNEDEEEKEQDKEKEEENKKNNQKKKKRSKNHVFDFGQFRLRTISTLANFFFVLKMLQPVRSHDLDGSRCCPLSAPPASVLACSRLSSRRKPIRSGTV